MEINSESEGRHDAIEVITNAKANHNSSTVKEVKIAGNGNQHMSAEQNH